MIILIKKVNLLFKFLLLYNIYYYSIILIHNEKKVI